MTDIIIREAREEDLQTILDIFNYELINTEHVYSYEPFTLDYMLSWYRNKAKLGFPLIVAELENTLVGYATYGKFREREAYNTTVEHSVYIHHLHRRKGLARKLMEVIIKEAKKNGIRTLVGGLNAGNHESLAFHLSLGFEEVAHFKSVAKKFGRWLDLKFVQMVFEEND